MQILIRGSKVEITDAMRDYVEEKLKKLDKYLENSDNVKANVLVKIEGHKQTVEITIPLKNFIIRSEETQDDFYASVDKALDVMERQIRKNKTKIKAKANKTKMDFAFDEVEEENNKEETIIKHKMVEVKPMDAEEAVLQMELLGHQFYLFRNVSTDKEAVVYKRKNGGYGVIEAE